MILLQVNLKDLTRLFVIFTNSLTEKQQPENIPYI